MEQKGERMQACAGRTLLRSGQARVSDRDEIYFRRDSSDLAAACPKAMRSTSSRALQAQPFALSRVGTY